MFFKRIFGRGKPQELKIESLPLDSIQERIHVLEKEKLTEIQPKLNAFFEKISERREWILAELKNLAAAESAEEVHPGLYKTVDEAKRLLIDKLTRALTNIRPPGDATSTDLVAFDSALTKSVNLSTDAIVAHGRFVARLFAPQLHVIESRLREMHGLSRDVHTAVEKVLSEIRSLEGISSKIVLQTDLIQRGGNLRADIASFEKHIKELEEAIGAEKTQLTQLTNSEEFRQLESFQRELERIEHELSRAKAVAAYTISNFSRPLRKMRKLMTEEGHKMHRETAEILELCIENPLEVFLSDERLAATTTLLQKMLGLIESDKISLNARERRRKIEDARSLLTNETLTKLRQNLEQLRAKREALENLCRSSPLLKKKEELEHALDRSVLDLKYAKTTLEELRRDLQNNEKEIDRNKGELEEAASGVIGATVKITS